MQEINNMQDVYCTQPKKVNGLWVMNVHTYGETLGVAQFKTKENAFMFRDELDNWDKIGEKVSRRKMLSNVGQFNQ
ncbi:MAG: hypothetical protein CMI60_22765 [Parvibaculum sp.]|nr:hypothetical protein [Parvibaculum sp.]